MIELWSGELASEPISWVSWSGGRAVDETHKPSISAGHATGITRGSSGLMTVQAPDVAQQSHFPRVLY